MAKLTKTLVDELVAAESDQFLWDSDLKGFGVRVKPSGAKTYFVQYRNADGLSRRMVIGKHGALTPDKARKLALKQLGAVAGGGDPAGERKRLCHYAGLKEVTLHTLRHTFASVAADLGYSELTIAGLLGHASLGVTQRYVHLDKALAIAADEVSGHMLDLLLGGARRSLAA